MPPDVHIALAMYLHLVYLLMTFTHLTFDVKAPPHRSYHLGCQELRLTSGIDFEGGTGANRGAVSGASMRCLTVFGRFGKGAKGLGIFNNNIFW